MLHAICFSLDQSKNLSSGNGLISVSLKCYTHHEIICEKKVFDLKSETRYDFFNMQSIKAKLVNWRA